jgi:hypothetical protein
VERQDTPSLGFGEASEHGDEDEDDSIRVLQAAPPPERVRARSAMGLPELEAPVEEKGAAAANSVLFIGFGPSLRRLTTLTKVARIGVHVRATRNHGNGKSIAVIWLISRSFQAYLDGQGGFGGPGGDQGGPNGNAFRNIRA